MKRLLPFLLLLFVFSFPAEAQNPTSKVIKRAGYVAGKRGDIFVHSSTGVTYMCKSASCTSGGSGWASMDASSATALPESDATAFVKGSSDATKLLRFEVDGFTAGQTRVITPPDSNTSLPVISQTLTFSGPTAARTITLPDANFTVARTDAGQTFSGNQVFASINGTSNGIVLLQNAAGTGFTRLQWGGTSSSFPAIRKGAGALLEVVTADESAFTTFGAGDIQARGAFLLGPALDAGFAQVAAAEVAVTNGSTGRGALYFKRPLSVKTSNYTVTVADTNKIITNEGASGTTTNTLPTPVAGLGPYTFCVATAQALTIVPATPASEAIYVTTLDANDSIASSTVGHCVTLQAINSTTWMATAFTGSWP